MARAKKPTPLRTPSVHLDPLRLLDEREVSTLRAWLGIRRLDEDMKSEFKALLDQHCEGTRLWLRDDLFAALSNNKRVLWLGGDAGVGKSVLAAFLAMELKAQNQLGSYFFCKADNNERNNARKLVLYLAFGFALWQPIVGRQLIYIKTLEDQEQRQLEEQQKQRSHRSEGEQGGGARFTSVLEKPLDILFQKLILEPLNVLDMDKINPIAVVIDALDEIGTTGDADRSALLKLITKQCMQLPHTVKLVITSRFEDDIKKAFENGKISIHQLKITDEKNRADAKLYVEKTIQTLHPRHPLPPQLVDHLVENSDGLFIWLKFALTSLTEMVKNGQEVQLTFFDKDSTSSSSNQIMTQFYNQTFDRLFQGDSVFLANLQKVLACVILCLRPLSSWTHSQLLSINHEQVLSCLYQLQPVLQYQQAEIDDDNSQNYHQQIAIVFKNI